MAFLFDPCQVEDMSFVKVIPGNLDTLLYISHSCLGEGSCQVRFYMNMIKTVVLSLFGRMAFYASFNPARQDFFCSQILI